MKCKICSNSSAYLFTKIVLNKYESKYYQCPNCFFIQTEEPYWLNEAYESPITSLDIGLIYRNEFYSKIAESLIVKHFNVNARFLDFGGGYGMFVRMMRDRGFDFYRQDKYCDNLFARHFDIQDVEVRSNFELVTSFEVFEHLLNPLQGIEEMFSFGTTILFSTDLSPAKEKVSSWEYLVPEVGQHISLYNKKTLLEISKKFNVNLYTNDVNFHMLTPKKINPFIFKQLARPKVASLYNLLFSRQSSLLQKDYNFLKETKFN